MKRVATNQTRTSPKWPWIDLKAEYFLAYPQSKEEFFAKNHSQIPEKTWHESTVGWKEEREAYRINQAKNRLAVFEEAADKMALRHIEKGAALLDASFENLVTEAIDRKTGQKRMVVKSEVLSKATISELIRLGQLGAAIEREALEIRNQIIDLSKQELTKPSVKKDHDKEREYLNAVRKDPEALKAAEVLLNFRMKLENRHQV